MSSINGIDFNGISSFNGVSWNSVTNIGGVPVSSGGGCETVTWRYVGLDSDPRDACRSTFENILEYNEKEGQLYTQGDCGTKLAPEGYYSDGNVIYLWNTNQIIILDYC
jgi:hypothetical protein